MAVKKSTQNCFTGADCPPGYYCASNSTCVPHAKPPGILGNTSAKIGAGLIGAGLTAMGVKVAKNIKENKPIRQAKRAERKAERANKKVVKSVQIPSAKKGGMVGKRTSTKRK